MAILLTTGMAFGETKLQLGTLEWPPYAGEKLPNGGTTNALIAKAFKEIGVAVEFQYLPWERAKFLAENGQLGGYAPAWLEEVKPGFIASDVVEMSEVALIKKADAKDITFTSIDEIFKTYPVGTVRGYEFSAEITKLLDKHQVRKTPTLAPNEELLAKMQNSGRFPIVMTDPKVASLYVSQHNLKPIEVLKSLEKNGLVIALKDTPENRELMKKFNAKITQLKENTK